MLLALAGPAQAAWAVPPARTPAGSGAPRRRPPRGSLRPQFELLSRYTPLGDMNVGQLLHLYGRTLWDIRRHRSARLGVARGIRLRAVAALGGDGSARGREFARRCRMISRFTLRLLKLEQAALRRFATRDERHVRAEAEMVLARALHVMSSGWGIADSYVEGLNRRVACRIEREHRCGFFWPLYWVWSKLWC